MANVILLAEDYPDAAFLFRLFLKRNHVENPVRVVGDGSEAIAYLEGNGIFADRIAFPLPRILFLDLGMPGLDGFAVLEWLQNHPSVKTEVLIIVLSEYTTANNTSRALGLGAHSILPKPITSADMETLIRKYGGFWTQSKPPEKPN